MLVFSPAGICKNLTATGRQPGSLESILHIFSSLATSRAPAARKVGGVSWLWAVSGQTGLLISCIIVSHCLWSTSIITDWSKYFPVRSASRLDSRSRAEEIPKLIFEVSNEYSYLVVGPSFFTIVEIIHFWLWEHSQRRLSSNLNAGSTFYLFLARLSAHKTCYILLELLSL